MCTAPKVGQPRPEKPRHVEADISNVGTLAKTGAACSCWCHSAAPGQDSQTDNPTSDLSHPSHCLHHYQHQRRWKCGQPEIRPLYQVSRCCDASDPKNPPHTPDLQLHTQKVLSDTLSNYPNSLIKKTSPMMVLDHVSVQKGSVGAAYGNRIERFKSSEAFVMCGLAATNCSASCCVRPVFQITVPL